MRRHLIPQSCWQRTEGRSGSYEAVPMASALDEVHPNRRVVARLLPAPHMTIDIRRLEALSQFGAKQQMVEPQAGVPAPRVSEIVPERIDALAGVHLAQGVGPTLCDEIVECLPYFWPE